MVKLFEEEIHIMQLFYANQSIRNVRDFITVYSLLTDTPHKRTPLLNGRFFCDRPFHMLLLIKKILLSGLF
jgi:hypothetical protein